MEIVFRLDRRPEAEDEPVGPPVHEVPKAGNGISEPVLVKEVKPSYSADALRERVEGLVRMECVVLPDGRVGDIRITKSLHPAVDRDAIRTLRQWRFAPGKKEGTAVPVRTEIEMRFTIADGKNQKR